MITSKFPHSIILLAALTATALADPVPEITLAPGQVYDAPPERNVFPPGALNQLNDKGIPRDWDVGDTFQNGVAKIDGKSLILIPPDSKSTVRLSAALKLQPEWKCLATAVRLRGENVTLSDQLIDQEVAGAWVRYAFLDKDHHEIADAGAKVPADNPTYWQKLRLASFQVPPDAVTLTVNVEFVHATGKITAGRFVIVPVDPRTDAPPAAVIALHRAIKRGDIDAVKRMITADKRLLEARNADDDGGTTLHIAAWERQQDMGKMLLDMGADPAARDRTWDWDTAMWAAHWGDPQLVQAIMERTHEDPAPIIRSANFYLKTGHKNAAPEDYQACIDYLKMLPASTQPASTVPTRLY